VDFHILWKIFFRSSAAFDWPGGDLTDLGGFCRGAGSRLKGWSERHSSESNGIGRWGGGQAPREDIVSTARPEARIGRIQAPAIGFRAGTFSL
jgi:hypothetical protein